MKPSLDLLPSCSTFDERGPTSLVKLEQEL